MSAQGSQSLVSYQEETTWGVNPAGTAGTQNVSFSISKVAGDASGLANDGTVYTATINPDGGGAQSIAIVGSESQTMGAVAAQINLDLTGASAAVTGGGILVTSDTLGTSSSILIADTDLFSTLTNYLAVDAATAGTGSGAANFVALPHTSFGINLTKDIHNDDTIRSDRRRRFNVHGNRTVAGDIAVNFADTAFDDWIASALNSAWAADSISDGVTPKSFTVEQGSTDIAQYSLYTGVQVNNWSLEVPVDNLVTSTFSIMGKDLSISGTTIDGTVADPTIEEPFFHCNGTFTVGGVAVGNISSLSLSVDNEGTTNFALGSCTGRDITNGFTTVTGSMTVYFDDAYYFNEFINGAYSAVNFVLVDPSANQLDFTLPRVKYSGADRTIEGQGPIMITAAFEAFSDAGGPIITIDRS